MKNIHVIPTDKPSRLYLVKSNNKLDIISNNPDYTENFGSGTQNQYLYITSDEEIKEGDYRLNIQRDYFKKSDKEGLDYYNKRNDIFKKIILTTDQDLINDGVQPIDDEFLEWFVKNPSCEEVKINDWMDTSGNIAFGGDKRYQICNHLYEKIIIPKEEPEFIQINQDNPVTRGSTALVRNPKYQREMKK